MTSESVRLTTPTGSSQNPYNWDSVYETTVDWIGARPERDEDPAMVVAVAETWNVTWHLDREGGEITADVLLPKVFKDQVGLGYVSLLVGLKISSVSSLTEIVMDFSNCLADAKLNVYASALKGKFWVCSFSIMGRLVNVEAYLRITAQGVHVTKKPSEQAPLLFQWIGIVNTHSLLPIHVQDLPWDEDFELIPRQSKPAEEGEEPL